MYMAISKHIHQHNQIKALLIDQMCAPTPNYVNLKWCILLQKCLFNIILIAVAVPNWENVWGLYNVP